MKNSQCPTCGYTQSVGSNHCLNCEMDEYREAAIRQAQKALDNAKRELAEIYTQYASGLGMCDQPIPQAKVDKAKYWLGLLR